MKQKKGRQMMSLGFLGKNMEISDIQPAIIP